MTHGDTPRRNAAAMRSLQLEGVAARTRKGPEIPGLC